MAYLTSRKDRGVVIVDFDMPKLLDQNIITLVGKELSGMLESAGDGAMLLNFENVIFMSSAMLGQIVKLNKNCKKNEVKLKLSNIRKPILEIFKMTRLDKLLSLYPDEAQAMAAFVKEGWEI